MKLLVHNVEELAQLAPELLAMWVNRKHTHAAVVGLSGELGAGKTTFVQSVAALLGVAESVTSPTFVILKIYALENQPFERLVHIDAYRLASGAELTVLRLDDLVRDPGNLILIEWPERVADVLPVERVAITFQITEGETREVSISDF